MRTWINILPVAALLFAALANAAAAEEQSAPGATFVPRWLCICPATDCKPLPSVCYDWKQCCLNYCKKPLPCVDRPCLGCGPCYQCKPAPDCYPCPLCPAGPRCWSPR
jgi:hypothetical protein